MYKTALLIIDVQRGLFNRSSPVYKAKEVLSNINYPEDSHAARRVMAW